MREGKEKGKYIERKDVLGSESSDTPFFTEESSRGSILVTNPEEVP